MMEQRYKESKSRLDTERRGMQQKIRQDLHAAGERTIAKINDILQVHE